MPHATLKLVPGTDTNKTPALNEAAVSYTDLIRFTPDRSGLGLVQKIGGWIRYIDGGFSDVIRALKAWSDLEFTKYLAVGGEGTVGVQVYSPDNSSITNVTPRYITDDITANGTTKGFVTTSGSSSISLYVDDIPAAYSYVYFPTMVSVGNLVLFGPYEIVTTAATYFTFNVPELLTPIARISATGTSTPCTVTVRFFDAHTFYVGQSIFVSGVTDTNYNGTYTVATITDYELTFTKSSGTLSATTSSGGNVTPDVQYAGLTPKFTTVSGSKTVTVDFINHGYSVGSSFNAPVATTVGGVAISGLYTVTKVNTVSQFEITLDLAATSSTNGYENSGNIRAQTIVGQLNSSLADNAVYGGGVYNAGIYGSGFVPATTTGTAIEAVDWSLDNWGSILIASPVGGAIYYWQPVGSNISNLSYAPNAPLFNEGCFVAMPQRQIIAYGSSFDSIQDPLLLRWCDVEDFSVWIATANNQAGSYRIPTGSRIVGAMQASQQALVWTDLDLWSMTYIGQPFIYGFNKIGANAGLISRKGWGQLGGVVYWMSQKQFFMFGGNGVQPIQCPVWDQVFQNLYPGEDTDGNPYTDRIRCAANSQFNEITWYFPAHYTYDIDPATGLNLDSQLIGTGEINAYVKYNTVLNQWDYGYQHPDDADVLVGRTAWTDQSVLGAPIGAAAATSVPGQTAGFYVYQHEMSNDADGAAIPCGFTTGYASLSEGDNMTFIDQVWPDMKWGFVDEAKTAKVLITFFATNYPGDTPIQYGPYEVTQGTQYLSVRMRARYIAIGISSVDAGSFWRIGSVRYRYQADGKY
jgi:uncharacterized protein YbdZ (MbtH family)